ncbi:hypothetical protein QAD02_013823 [Eretmocerus hayati]|uniref:Uncharacterized protein n=1 Tax=Eretmocerus hayati TaxID=131215 RepID=A0ACC2P3N3_9HYME|nr:hypothetical protein QAD02_013823 [Eretmocerus hayati]
MRTVRRASLPVSEMDEHVLESFRSIVLRIAHHLSIWSRRAGVRRRCAMYHRSELRQTRDIDLLSRAFSWLLFSCPIRDLPRYHRRFFPSNRIAILAAGEIVRRRDMEHLPALNHLMEEYREMQVQPQSPGGRNPITTESSGFDIHELQNSLPAETSSIPCAQPRESSHTETQRQPQESQPSDIATNDSSPGALPSTQSGGGLGAPASANAAASEDIDLQVRPAGVRFTVVDAGPRYVRRFRINGRRLALRILPPPQGTLNPILWLENGSDISKLLANVVSKGNKRGEIPIGQLEMAKFIGSSATPVNLVGNLEILENAKRLTDPLKKAPKRAPPSKEPMTPLNPKLRVVEPTVPSPPLTRNGLVKKWLRYRI